MRRTAFILAAAALFVGCATAQADDMSHAPGKCFFVSQFENWKASDAKTIFIRVGVNSYYRLDLASTCPELTWPDVHLVMNVNGPDTICSAVDWDLKVKQNPNGIAMPCIVKTMTPLTPEQANAIPKKFKP